MDGERRNINDMLPTIVRSRGSLQYAPSFTAIFEALQELGVGRNNLALELIGCLLFQYSVQCSNHEEFEPGAWRYVPPPRVLDEIEKWTTPSLTYQSTTCSYN